MSGELLFELIEKAQWSFERKVHSSDNDKSWSLSNIFKKWFGSSIKLSSNAERFLKQTGKKSSPISLHISSNRLALVINNNICIISFVTSEVLLEIPLDLPRSDEYNYLNCLNWSNNGKLLAYGHWSGIVCVYSSNDGQLLHELPTKSLNRNEDSFVEIWFSGSDASQFIDLLCLKRSGELIRYVMSRDDIASCAEDKFDFNITCAIIDSNQNQLYIVPFNTKSIEIWKIVDTNPFIIKIKEILDEEEEEDNNNIYIYGLALSPNESYLVSILSDQSIVLYQNNEQLHCLSKLKIPDNRSFICDFNYWDNKTLILFYSDGSISFHEGIETLEEYRYESKQLNEWARFCRRTSNELYLIDCQIENEIENEIDEENSNIISRLFHSLKDSIELINERLILLEHSDPCRLIENLVSKGEYGQALRVCKVFNRIDLSDQIHEKALRLSSSQLGAHLTRIQSRLHVLQLCTTILYPTFNEQFNLIQFGLNQATRKQLFDNLYYSDQPFFQTIYDENLYLKDIQPKQIPLNIPQKQVLLYRRKLLDEKRKLYLYDDLINKYKIFQQYQSNIFEKFREWDYKQIALRSAREGHLKGLRVVLERAIPSISSIDILSILNEIPEIVPLSEYEDLIPKYSLIEEKEFNRKENDWSDEFLSPYEETKEEIDQLLFIEWYKKRILSFESFGFIENALQLCKHALEIENFKEFSLFYNNLYLEYLLNKTSDQDLTLEQIKKMSEEEIIDLILTFKNNSIQDDIDKRIQQVLLPSMDLIQQSNEYLKKVLIKKLQNNFDIYPIINSLKLKTNFKQNNFDQLIKDLILNVNSINQISICQQLLTLINDKQHLEYIIESCRIFIKWSLPMIPSEIIRILESDESLSNAIVLLTQSAIKEEMNKINISMGNELYRDLERICRHRLSSQTLSNLFISSLLKSDSIECFQIVRSMLLRFHIPLIIQAAIDYIDSAKNGQDRSILLAKHCLDLIDDQSLVVNERNLIESQNICDFFHYSITPLEIRRHPNPIQIIPAILNSNPQAYKNTSKLISLSSYLQTGNKQDKKDRFKRLHTNVFPFIDGKDYERLKLFYDIKKSLGDLTHAQKHIQAIQQLNNIINNDFDYKFFLSSPELFIEKYSNDSNIINFGLALDQIKISSSLIITSSWIYSYYLRYNPSSSLIYDLLNRITLFEDFNLCIENLLLPKNIFLINKRIKIIEYSIKQIISKEDQQWKELEEKLNKHLLRLEILYKLLPDYSQDELNQIDQCENIQQQEEILSNLLSKHGQFYLIIYLKNNIFYDISIYHILQLTIEKISQEIKSGNEDSYLRLDYLLENISMDDINKKELFSCLQQMCRSEIIDRRVRYKLIDKLDRMFDKQGLQSDDLLLFEQYRLSTLLSSFDSFTELKKEDIETDENRSILFQKYLLQSERLIHFESLIQILNNTWSKQQINYMKGSHGLILKNELILAMIEKNSDWERILTENIIQFDEEEMNSLIKYLYNSTDLMSYAYKLWLINPISSLADLLFRSPSELMIDKKFLLMSIERNRVNDLLSINPLLFDYYLNENLSYEEKRKVLNQIEHNEEFLLKIAQLFIHNEDYSSFISFGLIIDTLQKYFLNK
ncbi:unnamed protein product [Rotaria sordida]|uniref:Anaphase-promoting complex subunit 4-like WD40 domain-containing protein n=3 Tax=Rotaria sordida TaxID=392033 RepID=A0A814FSM0_9BILA|nr:unnamed protein product [Rotaria sordida]